MDKLAKKQYKKEYDKAYRAKNRDKIREYKINWYKEHEEELRIKRRERYFNNKEIIKKQMKE